MLVVKIDEEYTPELREAVMKLIGQFNVVSFAVEEPQQSQYNVTVDPKLRTSSESGDIGAALSAAVDRMRQRQNGQ